MTEDKQSRREDRDKALFDSIAISYVKKDISLSSRIARKQRLLQTINKINLGQSIDILEVGCGAGFSAEYLRGHYQTYTGIDYSSNLIDYARNTVSYPDVAFHAVDLHQFKSNEKFDVIVMIGVLHHIPDVTNALKVGLKLLKPGGYIVTNEPQSANFLIGLLRKIRAKSDQSYSEEQDEFQEKQITVFYQEAGFIDIKTYAQGFLSTPFAEVVINPQLLSKNISVSFCWLDQQIEKLTSPFLKKLSWNIITAGKKSD